MNGIDPSAPGGLFDSLRALIGTLAAMARTRVELFGTELEQEIDRIVVLRPHRILRFVVGVPRLP
jgi:uncharacterized membrane protein YqjE